MKSAARDLFRYLYLQSPRLLATSILLWGSSCATVSRWTAQGPIPVAPHVAKAKQAEKSSAVMHAYAEGEADDGKVRPLSHEAKAAPSQTNDPFAGATTSDEASNGFEQMLRKQQEISRQSKLGSTAPPVPEMSVTGPPRTAAVEQPQAAASANPFATFERKGQPVQDFAVQTVAHEETVPAFEQPVQSLPAWAASVVAAGQPECEPAVPWGEPQFAPPVSCPTAVCPPEMAMHRSFPPEDTSDEYICDGGDKHMPVHYNGSLRSGLDAEDTVVEFNDGSGEMKTVATNRTCVYSPRFGSVRSMTAPNEQVQILRATGAHDKQLVAGFDHRMVIDQEVQNAESGNLGMRMRASGLKQRQVDANVGQDEKTLMQTKSIGLHQSFAFFREGQFDLVDAAVLGEGLDAAFAWSGEQLPLIQGHYRSGFEVQSRSYAQEKVGVEDQRTPPDLKVTKLADKKVAAPGETVQFTLRFDNLGDREVVEVRVVDHLSPRLSYVDSSINSNLPGRLDVQNDPSGSQILTFEFTEPLAGHAGGWVTFDCKVR